MRRILLAGALCLIFGSSLSATTVSGCLLDTGAAACYTTGMFSFADTLDWGAAVNLAGTGQSGFGPALNPGNPANPQNVSISPWNARSVGNVNIFASLGTITTGTALLTRADNTFWGYGTYDTTAGPRVQYGPVDTLVTPNHLVTFAGHFNASPTNLNPLQLGEHLLGDISSNGPLVLTFGGNLSQIGFKIGSNSTSSNANFAATIVAYNGTTILHTYSINVAGGGGLCDSLKPDFPNFSPANAPVPCNDAAFIAMDAGSQGFNSIQVFTNITGGFYINGLQFNEVPEPGMTLLVAGGLAGLWLFSVARRRFAGAR